MAVAAGSRTIGARRRPMTTSAWTPSPRSASAPTWPSWPRTPTPAAFPGTAGEDSTLAYLERQFRSLGLEPVVNGSYRPEGAAGATHGAPDARKSGWRGFGGATRPAAGELPKIAWGDDLLLGSNTLNETMTLSGVELVFVGYGITAPEMGWDDYAGVDMRGKVALVLTADPGRAPGDTTLFNGRALTHYGLGPDQAGDGRGARGRRRPVDARPGRSSVTRSTS
jgi:hypothetical protein